MAGPGVFPRDGPEGFEEGVQEQLSRSFTGSQTDPSNQTKPIQRVKEFQASFHLKGFASMLSQLLFFKKDIYSEVGGPPPPRGGCCNQETHKRGTRDSTVLTVQLRRWRSCQALSNSSRDGGASGSRSSCRNRPARQTAVPPEASINPGHPQAPPAHASRKRHLLGARKPHRAKALSVESAGWQGWGGSLSPQPCSVQPAVRTGSPPPAAAADGAWAAPLTS